MVTAFDAFMRSLNELHAAKGDVAPQDFSERIHFWHVECGLPDSTRAALQKLRVWRNASLHRDKQRWQQEGPRDAAEAREHIAALQALLGV